MWVPEKVQQLEAAVRNGDLTETPSFDAKRELPSTPGKRKDLAVDVAAMATDGGVLLYGVAEDDNEQPTVLAPIPLAGAADQVANIVQTSISEVPFIEPREYPCPNDPSKGYLLVIVPQSARAPHQVTVGGDARFYGRGAKGNRRLAEGEVARLYERRASWSTDARTVLAEVVANSPVPPDLGSGFLHAFARPVAADPDVFRRAAEALGGRRALHQAVVREAGGTRLRGRYSPSLDSANYWQQRGADEWRLSTRHESDHDMTDPRIIEGFTQASIDPGNCAGTHFNARATAAFRDDQTVIFETLIAGSTEQFLAIMSMFYAAGGYHGPVDLGVAVISIRGAGSAFRSRDYGHWGFSYGSSSFERVLRKPAAALADAAAVAHELLGDFYEATTGVEGYNPFESEGR